jgi:hypothetical protein
VRRRNTASAMSDGPAAGPSGTRSPRSSTSSSTCTIALAAAGVVGSLGLSLVPPAQGDDRVPPDESVTAPSVSDPASKARALHHRLLAVAGSDTRFSDLPGLSPRWPFKDLIDPPTPFPLDESQALPTASIEWRFDGKQLVESFTSGAQDGLDVCRRLTPTLDSLVSDGAPCPVWGEEPDPDRRGRGSWSTAFVDCYEIAPKGPWIAVTHRGTHDSTSVQLVDFDDARDSIRDAGPPMLYTNVNSTSAESGLFLRVADFDANGSPDFLVGTFQYSLGLSHCHQEGMFILTDGSRRVASVQPFESIGTGLIDLDRNGRAEVLLTTFAGTTCLDEEHHTFWITRLLGFQDLKLVDLRDIHTFEQGGFVGRFPSFEWFAFDMKNRFKPLLSQEMKDQLEGPRRPAYRVPRRGVPSTP